MYMKRKVHFLYAGVIVLMLSFTACNDMWDTHYNGSTEQQKSNLDLYSYIKTVPDLSLFAEMLEITGYDTILNKPTTYTVWAPHDIALLGVDMADTASLREIVRNHISRFSYPTTGLSSKSVYMLDKKVITFRQSTDNVTFGGVPLINEASNIAVSNGILHTIFGYVPYMDNLWEYIGKAPELDSLRAYLYAQSVYEFDGDASVEIGTNDKGQSIYDSVILFSNPILDKIGALHMEDSTYTALLPTNSAWALAYDKIKDKYKMLGADAAKKQHLNTQWALVKNLIFREIVDDVAAVDSVTSTIGNVYKNPAYLFENATKNIHSNGVSYLTNEIAFKAEDSYQQSIIIEAENSSYGRTSLYANLFIRSGLGSAFAVSDGKYLLCEPNTTALSTPNSVTIPIPNTLSGTYNVYCVFLPSNIVASEDTRPYKAKFYLSYMGADGKQVTNATINSVNTVVNKPGSISAIFNTQGKVITKMFVTKFTFPYCNLYTKGDPVSNITTSIKVENGTKVNESALFDRKLRIDYIILEPVQ